MIRISTVGSSEVVAIELLGALKGFLREGVFISRALTIHEISEHMISDLFICLPTRLEEAAQKIPRNKIIILELIPSSDFYAKVAQIPCNKAVAVFNNNTAQAEEIMHHCQKQGIHLNFVYAPYEEVDEEQMAQVLMQADYIVGAETMVGESGILLKKYRKFIRAETQIIGAKRIATTNSIYNIMQWVAEYNYKQFASSVASMSQALYVKIQQMTKINQQMFSTMQETAEALTMTSSIVQRGIEKVEDVAHLTEELVNATNNIGGISNTIKGISSQTNLLALNAAIEAARVGDAGRGFAVVAQEVRKLAEQSRSSIDTIRESIGGVQKAVTQIVPSLKDLTGEFQRVHTTVQDVATISNSEKDSITDMLAMVEAIQSAADNLVISVNRLIDEQKIGHENK